jgi:hypothetical protein
MTKEAKHKERQKEMKDRKTPNKQRGRGERNMANFKSMTF